MGRHTGKRGAPGERVEKACETCGTKFLLTPSQFRYGRRRHCSHGCRDLSGPKNPNWAGGSAATQKTRRKQARHPEKTRARRLVYWAVRRGNLQRQPCEVCGAPEVHAHHEDYSKPLEVRWLCSAHHLAAHGR